jgi:polysaccharide export outer membrane protein
MRRFCLFLALFMPLVAGLPGCGVLAQNGGNDGFPMVSGLPAPALKAGDRLDITVADETAFSGIFTIAADGTVTVEPLGALPAAGSTAAEFQDRLRQRLLAGYLKNPQVAVRIADVPKAQMASGAPELRPSQAEAEH